MVIRVPANTRRRALALSAAFLLAAALAPSADAQTFGDTFVRTLTGNCQGLQGPAGPYGPRLAAICAGGGGVAQGDGSLSVDTRGGEGEEQRILKRLKDKRDGQAGSADMAAGLRGLSLFASGDYQGFEKGVTRFEPGYDRDTWGATLGADYSFDGRAVLGLAFNYSHADGTYLRRGGDFETDAFGPTLYGSLLPVPNLFVDAYVGYTRRSYTIDRRFDFSMLATNLVNAPVHGETDGDEYRAGIATGYDLAFGALTVGPRVGVNFSELTVDSYRERGSTGLEIFYFRQHRTSLTSTVGGRASFAVSTGFGVLAPQATFDWIHEFEDDQRVTYFKFAEDFGGTKLRFQNDTPDCDYFNAGVGLVLVLPGGVSPFVNVREFFGYRKQSSLTVTIGLRFAF
jgi:outer membrane autotransporter protein